MGFFLFVFVVGWFWFYDVVKFVSFIYIFFFVLKIWMYKVSWVVCGVLLCDVVFWKLYCYDEFVVGCVGNL